MRSLHSCRRTLCKTWHELCTKLGKCHGNDKRQWSLVITRDSGVLSLQETVVSCHYKRLWCLVITRDSGRDYRDVVTAIHSLSVASFSSIKDPTNVLPDPLNHSKKIKGQPRRCVLWEPVYLVGTKCFQPTIVIGWKERWGAGVEYHFQEFNEPYAPS